MDKAVARLNIERFCKKLYEETDATKRKVLHQLLIDEEARLAQLQKSRESEKAKKNGQLPHPPTRG
jgi:hypothetical protein